MFSTPSKLSAALFTGLLLAFQPVHARTVRDINNQSVELPQQVNRIADLWPANNQVVLMLGGADKLVATTEATRNLPWFAKVYPRIKNVPALSNGQTVQSEALLGVRPDVVLLSQPAMQQQVRRAGMKPVLVRFQDFNGLKQTVRLTADVIGGNAPANRPPIQCRIRRQPAFRSQPAGQPERRAEAHRAAPHRRCQPAPH